VRRRKFIILVSSATIACPFRARGQRLADIRRIGVLCAFAENDPIVQTNVTAFRQSLEKLGWTDSRNVHIDYRWGNADADRIRAQAIELVSLKPDVILATSALALQPLRHETTSIPVVFTQITDPVGSGFVESLSRPGGNITGFTPAEFSMLGKSLEVLKEAAPHVTRVAVILNPEQRPQAGMLRAIEAVAPVFKVLLTVAGVQNGAEIERAIDLFAREPNGGLIVLPNPITEGHRKLIITMAARHHLPSIYAFPFFARDGGLISYGVDLVDQYRKAAIYVDRILKGEKAGDLPIQQPTKFELLVNLKTAKALGLTVPPTLLARADEVIE